MRIYWFAFRIENRKQKSALKLTLKYVRRSPPKESLYDDKQYCQRGNREEEEEEEKMRKEGGGGREDEKRRRLTPSRIDVQLVYEPSVKCLG